MNRISGNGGYEAFSLRFFQYWSISKPAYTSTVTIPARTSAGIRADEYTTGSAALVWREPERELTGPGEKVTNGWTISTATVTMKSPQSVAYFKRTARSAGPGLTPGATMKTWFLSR